MLPPLEVGDLVAIRDAGAYGSAMASNYNRRPLPPKCWWTRAAGASFAGARRSTIMLALEMRRTRATHDDGRRTIDRHVERRHVERHVTWTPHRLRRARPERQADAGRAAARLAEAGRPQGPAGVVSRLRHLDRRGDRARAARRARLRARRDAAAVRREPLRAEAGSAALARRRADAGVPIATRRRASPTARR